MELRNYLLNAAGEMNIEFSPVQLDMLETYYSLLTEWNEKINLTALTSPEDVAVKHFIDSAALLNYIDIPDGAKIIDVGTGAGFPGIVLKIMRPDINLTLLDSLNKRLVFLDELLKALNLKAELIHGRAEDIAKNAEYRESFDLATARAVARLNVLSEYCLPFVKIGGAFAAMKGLNAKEELDGAKKAIDILGGKIGNCFEFNLPSCNEARGIIKIDKIKSTPQKYPRSSGKIKSSPL